MNSNNEGVDVFASNVVKGYGDEGGDTIVVQEGDDDDDDDDDRGGTMISINKKNEE